MFCCYVQMGELPQAEFMDSSIGELNIGTANVQKVREDTPLIEVLFKFVQTRVSALPVVDADDRLLDIYSKFDVINLAAEKTYNNLDVTVKAALQYRKDVRAALCCLTSVFFWGFLFSSFAKLSNDSRVRFRAFLSEFD